MAETLNLFRDMLKFAHKGTLPMHELARHVCDTFKDAQRFVVPKNGIILDGNGDLLEHEIRLPYPCICIEFEIDHQVSVTRSTDKTTYVGDEFDRNIVFARELEDGTVEIQHAAKLNNQHRLKGLWWVTPFKMVFPRRISDGGVDGRITPTHEVGIRYAKELGGGYDAACGMGGEILQPAFSVICELLEALACSNVKAELKPNKKRVQGRRPGELPYDDYHELVVYTHGSKSADALSVSAGDGPKRREHLRRGHVRRYKSGIKVWVQAHVVNAGSTGKIEKHYRVK